MFVLALAAVFVAIAVGFGRLANRPPASFGEPVPGAPAAANGAQLFETYCASCHTVEELRRVASRRSDRGRTRIELERFLEKHGDGSAEQDRAIVAYLMGGMPNGSRHVLGNGRSERRTTP
jgi:mono/diheme cytochrome c family protein